MEFGATHTAASMEEAIPLVTDLSWGVMASAVILTPGVLYGDLIQPAMTLASKGGTVVATAVAPWPQEDVKLSLFEMTLFNKQLLGTVFGSGSPRRHSRALEALSERQTQARRAHHQEVQARADQRRLPGHARRQEHSWRDRLRLSLNGAHSAVDGLRSKVVGRAREVELIVAALDTGRHVLLEGPPGTGKSTVLRAVAGAYWARSRLRRRQCRAHADSTHRRLRSGTGHQPRVCPVDLRGRPSR